MAHWPAQLLTLAFLTYSLLPLQASTSSSQLISRDARWPNKQLNVLLDTQSLNNTQQLILEALLGQLQHRTCLKINKLTKAQLNPFSTSAAETNSSFVYVFKSHANLAGKQLIGLSSFGCLKQGRQSMILTEAAFQFPKLVLRYHIMHTLGVANLTRPDEQVRQLLGHLPMNQKIRKEALDRTLIQGPYYAYATLFRSTIQAPDDATSEMSTVEFLNEEDLIKLKELYNCPNFQSRLPTSSPWPPHTTTTSGPSLASSPEKQARLIDSAEDASRGSAASAGNDAVQDIGAATNSLLDGADEADEGEATTASPQTSYGTTERQMGNMDSQAGIKWEKPMLLKWDHFHAQDAQLMQADQMKLSILNETHSLEQQHHSSSLSDAHKLLNIADFSGSLDSQESGPAKSEMLISFEQSNNKIPTSTNGGKSIVDPVSSLVTGTQVLKLCSCTCQTMVPTSAPSSPSTPPTTTPLPFTLEPTTTTQPPPTTLLPSSSSSKRPSSSAKPSTSEPRPTTTQLPATLLPPTSLTTQPQPETTTTTTTTTTTFTATISEIPPETTTATTLPPIITTDSTPTSPKPISSSSTSKIPTTLNTCELVEWLKPSKSIYSSPKIVWDMDRANQNYFICQTMINGELVPGKTHGFSCKVSSNGVAYEMHNFKLLTKPESVSLAWVQRKKGSLGRSNQPVVGGFSKNQSDSYMVSRCLVRDENNDVITLIGYVNSHGVGWFPFDDIQIECGQYDVLACVT